MKFPVINHINDVLWAIQDRDEFIVADRGDHKIVNYNVNFADTFPDLTDCQTEDDVRLTMARRECRGIIFDANGNIISRPYHKFFNALERKETSLTRIDISVPHVILEKLDGSFIRPFKVNGKLHLWTKMGATYVANLVIPFMNAHDNYTDFMNDWIAKGYTPIFEFCSLSQRIVVPYPVDRLVLTGIRHNVTGDYIVYNDMVTIGHNYDLDVVGKLNVDINDFQAFVEETRKVEGIEGYVYRDETGLMYKIKGEHYMNLHHTKDLCGLEKNALILVLQDKLDDCYPLLNDEDAARVRAYNDAVLSGMQDYANKLQAIVDAAKAEISQDSQLALLDDSAVQGYLKKQFALNYAKKYGADAGMLFKVFDGHDANEVVRHVVASNTGTQNKVDSVRRLLGNAQYRYVSVDMEG